MFISLLFSSLSFSVAFKYLRTRNKKKNRLERLKDFTVRASKYYLF